MAFIWFPKLILITSHVQKVQSNHLIFLYINLIQCFVSFTDLLSILYEIRPVRLEVHQKMHS